jgi:uncharacterized membrane protein
MIENLQQHSAPEDDSPEAVVRADSEADLQDSLHLQRTVNRLGDLLGRPIFVLLLIIWVAVWLAFNEFAPAFGWKAFDAPPFAELELTITLVALFLTAIIVATQRRDDRLADRRAQLTLHLAVLADRKNAKIIALLEEIRRDSPTLADRHDEESEEMSTPADANSLLSEIKSHTDKSS